MAFDPTAGRGTTLYDILPDGYGMLGAAIAGIGGDQLALPLTSPTQTPISGSTGNSAPTDAQPGPGYTAQTADPAAPIPAFSPLPLGPQALTADATAAAETPPARRCR